MAVVGSIIGVLVIVGIVGFIIVKIILRIFGHLNDMCRVFIVSEIGKNSWQAEPDHVFQQNDVVSLVCFGRQQNKP